MSEKNTVEDLRERVEKLAQVLGSLIQMTAQSDNSPISRAEAEQLLRQVDEALS